MSENASGRFETLRRAPNILVTEEDKRLRTLDDVFVDLNVKLTENSELRTQVLSRIRRRLHGRVDSEAAKSLVSELASTFGPLRTYSIRPVTEKPSDPTLLNLMFQCADQKRLPSKYERDPDKKWAAVLPLVPVEITVSGTAGKNVFHAFLASDSDRKYAEWHAPARFLKTEHKFWDFRTFLAVEILSAQTLRFATSHPAAPEFGQVVANAMVGVYGYSYRND